MTATDKPEELTSNFGAKKLSKLEGLWNKLGLDPITMALMAKYERYILIGPFRNVMSANHLSQGRTSSHHIHSNVPI